MDMCLSDGDTEHQRLLVFYLYCFFFVFLNLKALFSEPVGRDDMNNYISQYYSGGRSGEEEVYLI